MSGVAGIADVEEAVAADGDSEGVNRRQFL
jgi:hypothetical protein